tara:strand:- start:133 stop:414 length:282 start_codon:yes stop_codon:yes gene_type:complete
MSWERDFEGIPIEGKHTIYSFLFCANRVNHTYETMCDKELTAKRRYFRYQKKFGSYKSANEMLISFWKYVWENGQLNDKETSLIYHIRGLHKE